MVRRDRVRDRTDRGDRDVSYSVFSHLSFVFRSSFVVVSEKDGVLVSLSLSGKRKEKEPARSSSNPSLSDHKTGTR